MKLLFVLLCAFAGLTVTGQVETAINDPKATERKLDASFSGISVSDGIKLYLSEGSTESIAVSVSDAKFEDRFKTIVENGVLKIYFDNKGFNWSDNKRRKLTAYVSFKKLQKLHASGGADVIVTNTINAENLDMRFTSGTIFKGKVKASNLNVEQESGSMVDISGNAQKIRVDVESGAIFKGFALTTDYCNASSSSGGAIRISINKELDASSHSGGSIRFKGDPVLTDINVGSGGVVKKA